MTTGLVTVMSGKRVLAKVVTGCCDCDVLTEFSVTLGNMWPLTAAQVFVLAQGFRLGCNRCLVVVTGTVQVYNGKCVLDERYRSTFDQPKFCPRSPDGTCDHSVMCRVGAVNA